MEFEVGMEVNGFGYASGKPYTGIIKYMNTNELIIVTENSSGIIIRRNTATPIATNNRDALRLLRRD